MTKTKSHPRKRFAHIYDLCKTKNICEGGDEMEKANADPEEGGEEGKKVTILP